jgi:hypothetical protein
MFPALEAFANSPGLLSSNFAQHKAFEDGLHSFYTWLEDPKTVSTWTGKLFREKLDAFAPALNGHMHAEPESFFLLKETDSKALQVVYEEQARIAQAKGDVFK